MKIAVHSLAETLFEGEAIKLIAYTPTGQITVLDGHIPLITTLTGPKCSIVSKGGKPFEITLSSGVLEVRPDSEVVALIGRTS